MEKTAPIENVLLNANNLCEESITKEFDQLQHYFKQGDSSNLAVSKKGILLACRS
jgi:hypothetical protein